MRSVGSNVPNALSSTAAVFVNVYTASIEFTGNTSNVYLFNNVPLTVPEMLVMKVISSPS